MYDIFCDEVKNVAVSLFIVCDYFPNVAQKRKSFFVL